MRDQKGAALVTALMLTTLALVVALALLYTVSAGSRISASQKRYRSALSAAQGGVELVTQEIIPRLLRQETESQLGADFALIGLSFPAPSCLGQKLTTPSAEWSPLCAGGSPDPDLKPDLSFNLGGGTPGEAGFQVSVQITDSVPGNSDTRSVDLLEQGNSVAAAQEQVVHPRQVPGLYHLALQGVGGAPREKARLSVLYAY